MNSTIKIAIGGILILVVFGAVAIIGINSERSSSDGSTSVNTQPNLNVVEEKDVAAVITYTGTGFEPNNIAVTVNSQIRVRNRSIRVLQFVSDPYIEQSDNPELNQGTLNPGESKTFYLSQTGRWGYHNALDPSETGMIVVR